MGLDNELRTANYLGGGSQLAPSRLSVVSLALSGAVLTYVSILYGFRAPDLGVVVIFALGSAVLLWSPWLQHFPLGPKLLLVLLTLRPLLDAIQPPEGHASFLPLRDIFALITAVLLIFLGRKHIIEFVANFPSNVLVALLALTVLAWVIGGVGAGANGFLRTSWGLLLALFLGTLLRTEAQIETFIRTLFYSSSLVVIILAFNLKEGEYIGNMWRISGQFGVANTLAAVCFSLFLLGLYTFECVRTGLEKRITICLLSFLAFAIVLTQSRTVTGLLVLCLFLWLWIQGHKRAFYALALSLLLGISGVLLSNGLLSQSRMVSSISFQQRELSEDVVNLTGRTYLWAKTLDQFAGASTLHKVVGLGWGTVFANFETFGYELSSVTENSFLWFLVGSGILGLVAFSTYLACAISKSWTGWRRADTVFERRLSSLAFLVGLVFVIEGFTTDLVLSPVASSYLYAVLSIFMARPRQNIALKAIK